MTRDGLIGFFSVLILAVLTYFIEVSLQTNDFIQVSPNYKGPHCWSHEQFKSLKSFEGLPHEITIFYFEGHNDLAQRIQNITETIDAELNVFLKLERTLPFRIYIVPNLLHYETIGANLNTESKEKFLEGALLSPVDFAILNPKLWPDKVIDSTNLRALLTIQIGKIYPFEKTS